jgi:hypothetical protein
MLIDQKLVLTQKLEALEINIERSSNSPNLPRQINNFGMSESLLSIVSNQNNNLTSERGRFITPQVSFINIIFLKYLINFFIR